MKIRCFLVLIYFCIVISNASAEIRKTDYKWFIPWISFDTGIKDTIVNEIRQKLNHYNIRTGIAYLTDITNSPYVKFCAEKNIEFGFQIKECRTIKYIGNYNKDFEGLKNILQTILEDTSADIIFGADIGSYLGRHSSNPYSLSSEAFIRWTQFAAFSPVMQLHLRKPSNQIWNYIDQNAVYLFRDYSYIHIGLKPYLISAAAAAEKKRKCMIQPVFINPSPLPLPQSSTGRENDTYQLPAINSQQPATNGRLTTHDSYKLPLQLQYLLGSSLLAAPVVTEKTRVRRVQLPEGIWYDFWSGIKIEYDDIEADAPLEFIPVFIKGGIFFPMLTDTLCNPGAPFSRDFRYTLRFFPDTRGIANSTLYDENANEFTASGVEKQNSISIKISNGKRDIVLWIDNLSDVNKVKVNGKIIQRINSIPAAGKTGKSYYVDNFSKRLLIFLPKQKTNQVDILL